MKRSSVIAFAGEAGFRLRARATVNANPKDTHDYPKGVWTLPPTYRRGRCRPRQLRRDRRKRPDDAEVRQAKVTGRNRSTSGGAIAVAVPGRRRRPLPPDPRRPRGSQQHRETGRAAPRFNNVSPTVAAIDVVHPSRATATSGAIRRPSAGSTAVSAARVGTATAASSGTASTTPRALPSSACRSSSEFSSAPKIRI